MAKLNKTDAVAVGICLDESLSMASCLEPTIKGFNDFIKKMGKQKGATTVTLTQFSSPGVEPNFRVAFKARKIEKVPKLSTENYMPRGNTPLFDAIGATITALDAELKEHGKDPPRAFVVIQTDGEENDSRDYTREQIVKMIEKREKKGWTFVFLGANMSDERAAGVAGPMGVTGATGYEGVRSNDAFVAVASAASGVRLSGATGATMDSFTASNLIKAAYDEMGDDEDKDDIHAKINRRAATTPLSK